MNTTRHRTDPQIISTPVIARPPECPRGCGYAGWPDETSSPYRGCDGKDQAMHRRPPVAEAFRTPPVEAESPFAPSQPKPRRQAPRPSNRGRGIPPATPLVRVPKGARGRCGTCNRDIGLRAGPDGPITFEHNYIGNRCGGSGYPPRATAGAR
jgi:hypothetical protein